jgi:para-aminobenzoate synthetase/4-amino-4-deoxychorismate lyase
VREDGLITEGSFTSLFVERDGKLLTPAAELGLLPGVLRRHLLDEGSVTNLFVERNGKLLTPPSSVGLLPGILRGELLAEGRAAEAELTLDDLQEGFFIGNALRGLMPARLTR